MAHKRRGDDTLLGISEAVAVTGTSKRTIARRVEDGTFPLPVYILGNRKWRRSDLIAWREAEAARPRRRTEDNLKAGAPATASTGGIA